MNILAKLCLCVYVRSGIDKVYLFIFGSLFATAVCRLQSEPTFNLIKLYCSLHSLLDQHLWPLDHQSRCKKILGYYNDICHRIQTKNLHTKKKKTQTYLQMINASLQCSWTLLKPFDNDKQCINEKKWSTDQLFSNWSDLETILIVRFVQLIFYGCLFMKLTFCHLIAHLFLWLH